MQVPINAADQQMLVIVPGISLELSELILEERDKKPLRVRKTSSPVWMGSASKQLKNISSILKRKTRIYRSGKLKKCFTTGALATPL